MSSCDKNKMLRMVKKCLKNRFSLTTKSRCPLQAIIAPTMYVSRFLIAFSLVHLVRLQKNHFCSLLSLGLRHKLLCCRSEWVSEWVTIESEPTHNRLCRSLILETSPESEFSSEYFTEILLSYGILSNERRSKLHAVIDCLFFIVAIVNNNRCMPILTSSVDCSKTMWKMPF